MVLGGNKNSKEERIDNEALEDTELPHHHYHKQRLTVKRNREDKKAKKRRRKKRGLLYSGRKKRNGSGKGKETLVGEKGVMGSGNFSGKKKGREIY